ncbi:MAG: PDZ domain-containing protein [Planctomycetes bacterium]|nr:PDZ domain-containing protein [Planctomycetota bacterium]
MGRSSDDLDRAAADYVCVRITDMAAVDLGLVRFDFDLTFAVVLMHADGTVYHRYGSRGPASADGYLSLSSLARLLTDALPEHRAYDRDPKPPRAEEPRPAIELPALQRRIASGQKIDCVHCHTINDAERKDGIRPQSGHPDEVYVFPDPERVGLTLDREQQNVVAAVTPDSPAATAGLRAGDVLLQLGNARILTFADVQWQLHNTRSGQTVLPLSFRREDEESSTNLLLAADWKRCDPADYAWRPYKWTLSPAPGFGGPTLDAEQKAKLGLAPEQFAMRVRYLVTWGERAHRGRAAAGAGLEQCDVLLSFAGKSDFTSTAHFHAWVRLTRKADEEVEFVVLRGGECRRLRYRLPR